MMATQSLQLIQNELGRLVVVVDVDPTTLEIVEVADPVTGDPISILDSALAAITFPDSLTQTPGNPLSWFTQEYIVEEDGNYVVEFNPGIGSNFSVDLKVLSGSKPTPSLQTCDIEDHVVDPQGNALENVTVSARILASPFVLSGAGLSSDLITAKTDSNGFFTLTVVRGTTLDVIIPAIGYRRTIVVPDQAEVNLFSIAAS